MKNLSITCAALSIFALSSCHKTEEPYSYVKKSSRGNFTINANGNTYNDTITQNNSSNFNIASGTLYSDTGLIGCQVLGLSLYDSNVSLYVEARSLNPQSKTGVYKLGTLPSSSWSTLGTFTFTINYPYTYYNGNSQDTTGQSYVTVTSYTDNGKVQEIKGTYTLRTVYPSAIDITGNFDIRK